MPSMRARSSGGSCCANSTNSASLYRLARRVSRLPVMPRQRSGLGKVSDPPQIVCYGKAHRRLLRMKTPSCGRRRLSSLVESMNAVRAVATVMVGLIHLKPTNLAVAVLAICRHVDVENMPLEDTLLLWRKGSLAPVDHLHC